MPTRRRDVLVPANLAVVVGVDVDESGGQEVALGVDDPTRLGRAGSRWRDVRDLPIVDHDVPALRRSARAVDDGCVPDDQIVHSQSPPIAVCAEPGMIANPGGLLARTTAALVPSSRIARSVWHCGSKGAATNGLAQLANEPIGPGYLKSPETLHPPAPPTR